MKNKKPSERIHEEWKDEFEYAIRHDLRKNDASHYGHNGAISEIGKILDEMQEKIDKLSE